MHVRDDWREPNQYLDFLLVLEAPLVDDDVLDSPAVSELLLKHGVELEELLRLVFRDPVQSVLVDHPNPFKLRKTEDEDAFMLRLDLKARGFGLSLLASFITNLFLCLLELCEGHKEVFVHVILSEELHRPLVHLPAVSDVAVLLLEPAVLDPVLHLGVNEDECSGVRVFLHHEDLFIIKSFKQRQYLSNVRIC